MIGPAKRIRTRSLGATFILSVSIAVVGCSAISKPDPPLTEDVMVALLAELHLVQARLDTVAPVEPGLRDSVFAKYQVSAEQFEAAVDYYVDHPEEYIEVYNRVVDRLNQEREEL